MSNEVTLTVNGDGGYELITLSKHYNGEEMLYVITYEHKESKRVKTSVGYYNMKENKFNTLPV